MTKNTPPPDAPNSDLELPDAPRPLVVSYTPFGIQETTGTGSSMLVAGQGYSGQERSKVPSVGVTGCATETICEGVSNVSDIFPYGLHEEEKGTNDSTLVATHEISSTSLANFPHQPLPDPSEKGDYPHPFLNEFEQLEGL